ncbi:TetR/AcrR family transcriptional regulator [Pseudooceanicola onchidii]|uniref:TetR/AcrR family transcriptional regulator n=1 Tax=Pseudooceanicola onchidii TaxID=2562279 RepID=UPI0010AAA41B|nr:TetR/AcrR family transcriptional regulator [Pseudooceanicola onchidii]
MDTPSAPLTATSVDDPTEPSDRFRATRDRILDASAQVINDRGLRGLTFVSVAEAVKMNTTSITYYFKRKELLAAATLERTIDEMEHSVDIAARQATPEARVDDLLRQVLDQSAQEKLGHRRPLARLSDLRSLNEPLNTDLNARYMAVFRKVVGFFDPGAGRDRNWARTHILLDTLHWCRVWLSQYSIRDYDRVHARMMELYRTGYAQPGAAWAPARLAVPNSDADDKEINRETYLRAATIMMNERGYRGASVERIAGALNLSKGSFYHHLDGKDGLVTDCFDRSYTRISLTQRAAMAQGGSWYDRLTAATAALTEVQFDAGFPLLRVTALSALPQPLRQPILARSDRISQRFAGMMIDGITEGSIRPIDPLIASQCLIASLNSAFDFRLWAANRPDRATAVRLYSEVLAFGMLSDHRHTA